MNPFDAAIFDMDGVIVDSEPLHEQAFRDVFAELGFPDDSHGLDFGDFYGMSDEITWNAFLRLHPSDLPLHDLLLRKRERLLHLLHREKPVYDGFLPLLHAIRPSHQLGLASGSPHPVIDGVLGFDNLRSFFSAIVSASDVPREKPAPDIFLRAAELLKVPPHRCCVIEDSVAGVQGGREAGMTVIAITNSFPPQRLAAAHYIVNTYDQIRDLLLPHTA